MELDPTPDGVYELQTQHQTTWNDLITIPQQQLDELLTKSSFLI